MIHIKWFFTVTVSEQRTTVLSELVALAHTRQTKTSILSSIFKHYTATVVEQPWGSLGKTMILVFPIINLVMKDTIISSYLMKWYNSQGLDNRKVNIRLTDDAGSDPFPRHQNNSRFMKVNQGVHKTIIACFLLQT